jgi:hypothetical protein
MIGKPEHLVLRERVAKGELPGPTIYTAGPPQSELHKMLDNLAALNRTPNTEGVR